MFPEWQACFQAWAREKGIDVSGAELVHWLRMVNAAYTRAIEAHLAPLGLSGPRLRILVFLFFVHQGVVSQEGISPSLLGRWRGVSKSTMSILLRSLEEEGWITRTVDPQDRRRIRLRLTEKARTLIERHAPAHLRFLNRMASSLSPEERQQLIDLLRKLYHGLREQVGPSCSAEEGTSTFSTDQE